MFSFKRMFLIVILCMLFVLISTSTILAQEVEQVELVYAGQHAEESFMNQLVVKTRDYLEDFTGGRMTIKIYHSGQLGDGRECQEALVAGRIDMHIAGFTSWSDQVPEVGVFEAPYLFTTREEAYEATRLDNELIQDICQQIVDKVGVRFIGVTTSYGTRHMTANKPIYHPDDAAGLRIRIFTHPVVTSYARVLGGIPVPIAWTEVPTALATGTVDAQENPVEAIRTAGLYEFQDYLMLTGHMVTTTGMCINEETWQSLSPKAQEYLDRATTQAMLDSREEIEIIEKKDLDFLREKMTVIERDELDIDAFVENAKKDIAEHFADEFAPLWFAIKGLDWEAYKP